MSTLEDVKNYIRSCTTRKELDEIYDLYKDRCKALVREKASMFYKGDYVKFLYKNQEVYATIIKVNSSSIHVKSVNNYEYNVSAAMLSKVDKLPERNVGHKEKVNITSSDVANLTITKEGKFSISPNLDFAKIAAEALEKVKK